MSCLKDKLELEKFYKFLEENSIQEKLKNAKVVSINEYYSEFTLDIDSEEFMFEDFDNYEIFTSGLDFVIKNCKDTVEDFGISSRFDYDNLWMKEIVCPNLKKLFIANNFELTNELLINFAPNLESIEMMSMYFDTLSNKLESVKVKIWCNMRFNQETKDILDEIKKNANYIIDSEVEIDIL